MKFKDLHSNLKLRIYISFFQRLRSFLKKYHDRLLLIVGSLLFSGGFAVLAYFNLGWILLLGAFIFTIGELIYVPIHQALLASMVKDIG